MRNILKVASLLAISLFISCSEEESGRDLGQNGFSHNETFYVLNNAFVTDEDILDSLPAGISVTLSNVNLADSSAVSNVSVTRVKGGASGWSSAVLNAIIRTVSTMFSMGQAVGSAIRRAINGSYC